MKGLLRDKPATYVRTKFLLPSAPGHKLVVSIAAHIGSKHAVCRTLDLWHCLHAPLPYVLTPSHVSLQALHSIEPPYGLGPFKVQKFGDRLLAVVRHWKAGGVDLPLSDPSPSESEAAQEVAQVQEAPLPAGMDDWRRQLFISAVLLPEQQGCYSQVLAEVHQCLDILAGTPWEETAKGAENGTEAAAHQP